MKKNRNKKRVFDDDDSEISPIVVTIVAAMLSFVIVAGVFFVQTGVLKLGIFDKILPKREISLQELLDRGRTDEAIELLQSRPDIVQGSDTSLYTLGKAWYLSAWQRYDADNWRTYAQNPDDWFVGSDVDKALHNLKRSAESTVTYADATTLIGVIYMEKGWFARAKTAFENVLKRDASHRDAYLYYGVALSRAGQNAAAVRHLESWLNHKNDADFLKNLFYLHLFNIKDYEKAAALGDMFLKVAPRGNPDIPKIRRELHDLSGRFPEHFSDTMTIIRDRPPEFRQRQRVR